MREKIVEIARNEVGYHEGENNWTIYGQWFGMQDEWCAMFVAWCAFMAGIGVDIIPKLACCDDIGEWFDKRGQYRNSRFWGGNYTPLPGDLILFDWDKTSVSDHVGIVEYVEGNMVHTIEGNSNDMVARHEYSLDDKNIRAFCVPAYKENEQPSYDDKAVIVPRQYINNDQERKVYADLFMNEDSIVIGTLNPNEKCCCFGVLGDAAIVMYEIDGSDHNWKIGFTDYIEGVK